jgi:hypothetical protein
VALDQSALLDVLDALKAADGDDRIRQAAQTIYQALIEAELTSVIGAGPTSASEQRTTHRNGTRTRLLPPRQVMSNFGSPSCARARSSRRCWSHTVASTGRCWRW